MAQFTYKDIEEFLLDDDFFQWARYGSSDNGFNLESYKLQHPGCEEKIELAVAMVRSMKVVENSKPTSREYKMQSFNKMMSKLQQQPSQPVQSYRKTFPYRRIMTYVASVAALLFVCLGTYYVLSRSGLQETTDVTVHIIDSLSHSGQVQIILDGKQAVTLDKNNAEIRVDEDGAVTVDKQLVAASKLFRFCGKKKTECTRRGLFGCPERCCAPFCGKNEPFGSYRTRYFIQCN